MHIVLFLSILVAIMAAGTNKDKPTEKSLLARIAWMYYLQGLTQEEIGVKLDFSRTKVTRLLARAREEGIVEINISQRFRTCFETEERLKNEYNLIEIRLVPTGNTEEETRASVGMDCARYIESLLEKNDIIGCAWGRSLYQVGYYMNDKRDLSLTVVQLMGGINKGGNINPQKILELIATKLNAEGVWLNTPAVVDNEEIKNALLSDIGIKKALNLGLTCKKALLGIGDVSDRASLLTTGSLSEEEMKELREAGAVGDILSRFYDVKGKPVESVISRRVIGIGLDEVKRIPLRIGVCSGRDKAAAILGALEGGYINVLVSDEETALAILKLKESIKP